MMLSAYLTLLHICFILPAIRRLCRHLFQPVDPDTISQPLRAACHHCTSDASIGALIRAVM